MDFIRVFGGIMYVKTVPESIDHPGLRDTYLLNETLSWFPRLHQYKANGQLANSLTTQYSVN